MSRPEDRAPRLAKTSVVGSLPDNKEGRDEGRVSSAAKPPVNKLAVALAAREAMREHRKGEPISFSEANWRRFERKGKAYGTF